VAFHHVDVPRCSCSGCGSRSGWRPGSVSPPRWLETIRSSAHEALQDLREILGVLREPASQEGSADPLRPQPSLADLQRLLESLQASGVVIDTRHEVEESEGMGALCSRTLYWVAQEALTNAVKHAPGTPIQLCLIARPNAAAQPRMVNQLPANGLTATAPGTRTGLIGIRERVALAGGQVFHPSGIARWLLGLPGQRCAAGIYRDRDPRGARRTPGPVTQRRTPPHRHRQTHPSRSGADEASRRAEQRLSPLTCQERAVATAVARGHSNTRIAKDFHLGLSTVTTHISRAMAKLGLENRTQLALLVHDVDPAP
jgi:DNA-binding CsgD family transcriptional regulator